MVADVAERVRVVAEGMWNVQDVQMTCAVGTSTYKNEDEYRVWALLALGHIRAGECIVMDDVYWWLGSHKNEDENRVWALRAAGARTTETNSRKVRKEFQEFKFSFKSSSIL